MVSFILKIKQLFYTFSVVFQTFLLAKFMIKDANLLILPVHLKATWTSLIKEKCEQVLSLKATRDILYVCDEIIQNSLCYTRL